MTQITAYINFDGNCREALSFYQQCLGGELNLMRLGDSPADMRCPVGMEDQIMHGALIKDGLLLMGSDMQDPNCQTGKESSNIALSVNCSSEEETSRFFNGLAAGGKIQHQLAPMFWGGIFGTLTDKFGIRWMFNYDKNQNN